MKRLMIAAALMLSASAAMAGDSDVLKTILKAKTYAEAASLLQNSLNQLANSQEKAKAYNYLTKLALEKFDKENNIQALNMQAQLTKQAQQPYDTLGFYEAAYNATISAMECKKYDSEPNEKGKVSPKFIKSLSAPVSNARMQLVTAGNYYAQKNDQDGVLKYWGTFLDTENEEMFQGSKDQEKSFLGQVAYYTAMYANQAQKYDLAEKYADIAIQDSAMRKDAMNFKFAIAQRNLKTHADSVNYVNKLKTMYAADPKNEMAFSTLCNMYSGLKMDNELQALLKEKLAADPNNFTAWAMKGQILMNENSKKENANWDECIECFKKASEIDNSNVVVLTYLGFSINAKASQINGNAAAQKTLYKEAAGYLEHAKELDPNREKANWAYPLYQCYYQIYGANDARTKELEAMLK